MTNPRRVTILVLFILLTLVPARHAQQAQDQSVVRISTQLVQIDAVVTDKKGKHVENLTEEDFELFVDGKKQTLTHFSHVNLPAANLVPREQPKTKTKLPPAPAAMPTRQIELGEVRRTIAFVVDDLGLGFQSTNFVRETLRTFVDKQMRDGDLVAIIRTGNGLGMLEQFTSDKRVLYAAIDKLMWNPLSRDMMPSFGNSPNTTDATDASTAQQEAEDSISTLRDSLFSTGTLGAVNFVVRSLRELPGRKSVILLSDGFRIYPSSDTSAGRGEATGSGNADFDNVDRVLQSLRLLVEQANRSSVVIYSIDAKGLQPFMPGPSTGGRPSASSYSQAVQSNQETREGPAFLAQQTGGFMITDTNDLNIGIQEALYDQQSYYLLGFDPEDGKFDQRRHTIKLKVTRPGLTVRSRSGFYGVNDVEKTVAAAKPKTRGEQIFSAMLAPLGERALSLRMTPYFFNSKKDGSLVRALFYIDAGKLTFKDAPDGRKTVDLDLAAFAFNDAGETVDVAAHRLALSFDAAQYERALKNGVAYRADFDLKEPGAYQFRAALRDAATGAVGSASQFIQIPDLKKQGLALSGLVLTAAKSEAGVVAARSDTTEAGQAQTADLQASPYVRHFPRTGEVQYGAAVYNASVDKKTAQTELTLQMEIYRDGKPVYQLPARRIEPAPKADAKHFDYVGRLRLNQFPEGDYLLRLVVTDALAKKKYARAEQWMDFSVR